MNDESLKGIRPILAMILLGVFLPAPSVTAVETAEETSGEVTQVHPEEQEKPESETEVLDPNHLRKLAEQVESPEAELGDNVPSLDPVFAEFPELLQSPAIEHRELTQVEKQRSDRYEAQFNQGLQYRRSSQYDRAIRTFVDMLEKGPSVEFRKKILLQLALIAELRKEWVTAQQVYSHYESLFPADRNIPFVGLRLAGIYRELGAYKKVIQKLHTVITLVMAPPDGPADFHPVHQRIALKAKSEIAEAHFANGDYKTAAARFRGLMGDSSNVTNPGWIDRSYAQFRIVECFDRLGDVARLETECKRFLEEFPGQLLASEVRHIYARNLQSVERNQDALEQLEQILEERSDAAGVEPEAWRRWQGKVGLEIADKMVRGGDFFSALKIYQALLNVDDSATWLSQVHYQIGLVNERLGQFENAKDAYHAVVNLAKVETEEPTEEAVEMSLDMARWRLSVLTWSDETKDRINGLNPSEEGEFEGEGLTDD